MFLFRYFVSYRKTKHINRFLHFKILFQLIFYIVINKSESIVSENGFDIDNLDVYFIEYWW